MREYIDDHNYVAGHAHRDIGTYVYFDVDAINDAVAAIDDYDEIDDDHFDEPNIPLRTTEASTRKRVGPSGSCRAFSSGAAGDELCHASPDCSVSDT
jgi:hypothetical protein